MRWQASKRTDRQTEWHRPFLSCLSQLKMLKFNQFLKRHFLYALWTGVRSWVFYIHGRQICSRMIFIQNILAKYSLPCLALGIALHLVLGLAKKFGQNQVSNSWNIAYIYKCRQDICCLGKYHCDSWHLWHLLKMVQGNYLSSLVIIRSVTLDLALLVKTRSVTNISDMQKCHQDIGCLDNCHHDAWHLLKIVRGTYF